MFIDFWERKRDRAWAGEGERERDSESEAGSRLWAVTTEPNTGGAWTHKPWDHDLSGSQILNQLSHPGAPDVYFKNARGGWIERELQRIMQKTLHWQQRAAYGAWIHQLNREIMTQAEVRRSTAQWTEPPRHPVFLSNLYKSHNLKSQEQEGVLWAL